MGAFIEIIRASRFFLCLELFDAYIETFRLNLCSLFTRKFYWFWVFFRVFMLIPSNWHVSNSPIDVAFPTVANSLVNDTSGVQVLILQRKQTLNSSGNPFDSNVFIFTTVGYLGHDEYFRLFKETFCNYHLSIGNVFIWLFCFLITNHTINESFWIICF